MKNTVLIIASFVCLSSQAFAEDMVLCIQTETLQVLDKDLKTPLFTAQKYETVLPFQDFAKKTTDYVKVEFTDRQEEDADNNVGYVKKAHIKEKSKCAGYKEVVVDESQTNDDEEKPEPAPKPVLDPKLSPNGIALNCCLFPMKKKPTASFNEGMRRFGASRSKGARAHAAADLYQTQYQPVYAIAAGKVLRDRVSFYLGTTVTEIEHPGGFIARYGEIASASLKPLKLGSTVKAGQLIGYIKKVNSKSVKSPMLHFELYTGKAKGPLTIKKGKFQRRSDLINPTQYLAVWEKAIK